MVIKIWIQRESCWLRNWKKEIGTVPRELFRFICERNHPALNQLYEILQRAYTHVLKPPRLHSTLPSPSRVAIRNPKAIRDKLVRFKLKEFIYKDAGTNICGHSNCDISKMFESGDQFESNREKKYRINFPFDCNSCCAVYLLAC